MNPQSIGLGIALAAVLAAAGAFLCGQRRGSEDAGPARAAAFAVAVAGAFTIAVSAAVGRVPIPPHGRAEWIPWLVAIGAVIAALTALAPREQRGAVAVEFAVFAIAWGGAVVMLTRPLVRNAWTTRESIAAIAAFVVVGVVCRAALAAASSRGGATTAWGSAVLVGSAAAFALAITGSAILGALAAILTAVAGGAFAVSLLPRETPRPDAALSPWAIGFAALLTTGALYSELPFDRGRPWDEPVVALLATAPLASLLITGPEKRGKLVAVLAALWVAIPAASAAWIAYATAPPPNPYR